MLVLSRKTDEQVVINGDIFVTVVSVNCGKVRLGIDAPANIEVHRREVYDKIQWENRNKPRRDERAA
jgi:carbon storage regulator